MADTGESSDARNPRWHYQIIGPNGAGKHLMNLMCGLRPTRGRVSVLGIPTDQPQLLFRKLGYCSQFDSFPRGLTGRDFITSFLKISGFTSKQADELAEKSLTRVDLLSAADRKIGAYSKGMRQRVRLAQAIAHDPSVLILDEPLNGLDPMVRAETIALFKQLAADGLHLIMLTGDNRMKSTGCPIESMNTGYVVAEGVFRRVKKWTSAPVQSDHAIDRRPAVQIFQNADVVEAYSMTILVDFRKIRNQIALLRRTRPSARRNEAESIAPVDDDLARHDINHA
jgi:ABC-2 type transport system ATP-binding protein